MYCPKCGTENDFNSNFCYKCGEKLIKNSESSNSNLFNIIRKKLIKPKVSSSKPYEIPPERLSDEQKTVIEQIDGYALRYLYKDVEISSWEYIPRDIKIGNRIIFMQEPTNEYDNKAVMLMFVPQRKKLGYLYRGKMQDMVNDYINRGDKVVARLSYLTFNPCKIVKIDIGFYKKVKKKKL